MNDDQRLSLLDRRAAAATAALDEAVQQVPVPEPGFDAPRRSVRRFLPLAVAAGLAVIALLGAALVFDDDEQSTIAEQPGGVTRLALPDPEALGYRVVGAFDGDAPDDQMPRDLVIPVTIQSPIGADDPWASTVVSYSLPADATTLDGEPVDVGGPEATLSASNGPLTVGWIDEPRVYYLRSARMSAGELVALARSAVATRTADGEPLRGHEIVHAAPHTDVFPVLASATAAAASRLDGIVYESDDGGFVVASGDGSADRWRASYTLANRVEHLTVRGREAVLAEFDDQLTEISWLEDDGTLVRVDSLGGEIPVDVLDHLKPISDADFADLVDEHGSGVEVVERHIDAVGEEIEAPEPILPGDESSPTTTVDDRQPMAQVDTEEGSVRIRATLLRAADRSGGREQFDIEINAEGTDGGTGMGQSLPDLATNVVLRDQFSSDEWTGVVIGGVIGPDIRSVDVVDGQTGNVLARASTTAAIQHSDHVVFLATVGPEHGDSDLVVVGTTAAGEEVRLSAPAQG